MKTHTSEKTKPTVSVSFRKPWAPFPLRKLATNRGRWRCGYARANGQNADQNSTKYNEYNKNLKNAKQGNGEKEDTTTKAFMERNALRHSCEDGQGQPFRLFKRPALNLRGASLGWKFLETSVRVSVRVSGRGFRQEPNLPAVSRQGATTELSRQFSRRFASPLQCILGFCVRHQQTEQPTLFSQASKRQRGIQRAWNKRQAFLRLGSDRVPDSIP